MTTQSSIPQKWLVPFANGDVSRVELPVTTADPTRASQTLGFPPLTMQPPESGGVPPQGEDFNGGMNQIARVAWWTLLCGGWTYDSAFATNAAIGGYPNGALLQSADFRGYWLNLVDNNQINPDTVGTNWVPGFQYGGTALTGLTGGTVTPTPLQAAKGSITLTGTLGSALTVILPAWTKNWTITNSTSGAFTVIVKTAAGSGVTIPQNGAPTLVRGDGTNITQTLENIPTAPQFDASSLAVNGAALTARGLQMSGATAVTATGTLPIAAVGGVVYGNTSSATTTTLPALSAVPTGATIQFMNLNSGAMTISRAGSDVIWPNGTVTPLTTIALGGGDTLTLVKITATIWAAVGGSVQAQYSNTAFFGPGQTRSLVTGSRAFGTPFTNTTPKPIFVTVSATAGTGGSSMNLSVGGNVVSVISVGTTGTTISVTGMVLPGEVYQVSVAGGAPTLSNWLEIR